MLSGTGLLLRRVVLARARVAPPLARELRRRCGATAGAPAVRRLASASVDAPAGGAGGAGSPLSALAPPQLEQLGVTAEEVAAAAAELAALAGGEEYSDDEEEDADGAAPNTWVLDTPRGRKELVLQGGIMLEPDVAERLRCSDNARISSSEFVKSSVTWRDCPPPKFPEFAFIGRSNVGKSSLINCLTARKSLAKVSNTPGAQNKPHMRMHNPR
jgi:hypothetical protein